MAVASIYESLGSDNMVNILGYRVDSINELGHGSFGTVYMGFDKENKAVALKKLKTGNIRANRAASSEVAKFQYLKDSLLQQNDHIVKVYDIKRYNNAMWIIMEYCDFGNLNDYFKNNHVFLKAIGPKVNVMWQIINGISFLHGNNFVHRDIKPNNILVKAEGHATIKLADFNLSKILNPTDSTSAMSSNVGTDTFKAPEFWNKQPPDNKVRYYRNIDVYAAGLTFTAMLQFQPGKSLMPNAEGSLQSTETDLPIGQIAFHRLVNRHPIINIVQHTSNDCPMTRNIKRIIHRMTHVVPQRRPPACIVESMFDEMVRF